MFEDIEFLDRVIGTHPERNLAILQLVADGYDQKDVAQQFGLSESSISEIKKANLKLFQELSLTVGLAQKSEQILYAKRKLRKKEQNGSKKDSLEWLQLLINLTKEERPLVDVSTHYHFTNLKGDALINEARRRGIAIPPEIERRLGEVGKSK